LKRLRITPTNEEGEMSMADKKQKESQFAQNSFNRRREHMKELLDLIAIKADKKSSDYKFYKSKIMDFFYTDLEDDFRELAEDEFLEECECRSSLRNGWNECPYCSGAGYKNSE
jgi:hypothetical protein